MRIVVLNVLLSLYAICSISQQSPIILGAGNQEDIVVTSSSTEEGTLPDNTLQNVGLLPNPAAASRFLAHATLGANLETIDLAAAAGFSDWIEEQFQLTDEFSVEDYTKFITKWALDSTYTIGGNPEDVQPQLRYWHFAWWQYTMNSPELLKNRIALALSEILVISELPQLRDVPLALANYYDLLRAHSFGNFRELLEAVTLHPAMGVYLTHMNNPKSNASLNRFPDENYAREVMQLFTIGLYELNQDGSRKILADGVTPIPTYDNEDIQEFAKIFTGLTWGDAFLFGQRPQSELSYTQPMMMDDFWHEPGEKILLNGAIVPDRNPVDGLADIRVALDNLFNHPNVGPFIGHKLIQRLVTSNPSPDYIERVAAAFNNNGAGVRGDMKAVIKAILLDEEARQCPREDEALQGMLREPMVRYAHVSRAFDARSVEGTYRNAMDNFYESNFQRPLASPSVFNFFQPTYQPIGGIEENGLVAPEFQILNSVSIMGYANEVHDWIMRDFRVMEYKSIFSGEASTDDKRVNLDLSDEINLGESNDLDELIERIDLLLTHGQMTDRTKSIIKEAVANYPENKSYLKGRLAIYLTLISPDYLILK